jgi:B12-binding domain/radical SAM domain protein of rhizo-twelve system
MRVALLNPRWTFEGSVYFGCHEPHLPLELGYAAALLESSGHEVALIDAHLRELPFSGVREELASFGPEMTVITTAPSYLFWRCAPPELRVPMQLIAAVRECAGEIVVVGPHASTTPKATLEKLGVRYAIQGECEEALAEVASAPKERWAEVDGVASRLDSGSVSVCGGPRAVDVRDLPALNWPKELLTKHAHHHHRFDRPPSGLGAEVESSRGCPFSCTFCAKENFRNKFRQRPLETVLHEIDALIESGVTYVYFVDEIFLPNRPLLEALVERPVEFGVQMRIDLFDNELLELLGRAGCVSIEAGVESVTREGRSLLAKKCRLSTPELVELLVTAKRFVPFVQANLLNGDTDPVEDVKAFRSALMEHGVWVNDPVPLFPYPGSPEYSKRWGKPDDIAWERALEHYLKEFDAFSDIQERRPKALHELEGILRV